MVLLLILWMVLILIIIVMTLIVVIIILITMLGVLISVLIVVILRLLQLILVICQVSVPLLELGVQQVDGDHEDEEDEGGDGPDVAQGLLHLLLVAPVALPHAVLAPVDVAVVLEHVVAVPGPEEEHQQVVPHQPRQHDPLAQLLGASDQPDVGQETDYRHHHQGTWRMKRCEGKLNIPAFYSAGDM